MTFKHSLVFWLSSFLAIPLPADAQARADGLAEAARLAAHAQTLEDQCRYRESSVWIDNAIDRLKRFRSEDPGQARAAGSLLGELEIHRRELKQQPALFDQKEQQVSRLLAASRTESADRLLRESAPPACDARFTRLEEEVARRQAAARSLIQQGEAAVRRDDRKSAIRTLQRAASIDAEAPGLQKTLAAAHKLRSSHTARNAIIGILVTGALGAGGYYAYQKYGKNRALISGR